MKEWLCLEEILCRVAGYLKCPVCICSCYKAVLTEQRCRNAEIIRERLCATGFLCGSINWRCVLFLLKFGIVTTSPRLGSVGAGRFFSCYTFRLCQYLRMFPAPSRTTLSKSVFCYA